MGYAVASGAVESFINNRMNREAAPIPLKSTSYDIEIAAGLAVVFARQARDLLVEELQRSGFRLRRLDRLGEQRRPRVAGARLIRVMPA